MDFLGQGDELIEAGIASAEMFELPPCGTKRSGCDEFGDYYTIRPQGFLPSFFKYAARAHSSCHID